MTIEPVLTCTLGKGSQLLIGGHFVLGTSPPPPPPPPFSQTETLLGQGSISNSHTAEKKHFGGCRKYMEIDLSTILGCCRKYGTWPLHPLIDRWASCCLRLRTNTPLRHARVQSKCYCNVNKVPVRAVSGNIIKPYWICAVRSVGSNTARSPWAERLAESEGLIHCPLSDEVLMIRTELHWAEILPGKIFLTMCII